MLTRRSILQGMAAVPLATSLPSRAGTAFDWANPGDRLAALVKLRGATDGRLCMGYVVGVRYAVPEHKPIPMMGILAATFSRYRRLDDSTYEARAIEVAFFTDVDTGALLERWKNPVTGTVVDVQQTRMGPSRLRVTSQGLKVDNPSNEAAGLDLKHAFLEPRFVGDNTWITEQIDVAGPPGPRPFVYTELTTMNASRAALEDRSVAWVPTRVDYQSLITYRPWMGFGDAPGHTIARGSGVHVARREELPPQYQELIRSRHPDVWNDPLAVLAV
ncbi:MAG: DUF1838 domain-containing protein [Gammaproteobacteria bacterium]|nr:DUF1838 domain-containing protein [Gammaproteobacteria bacterium]